MAKKICIVVQRYGLEVNGGAELHARQLAEHLVPHYSEVHVLTTKAIDYTTWKNEYTEDLEIINQVVVHRFPVEEERDIYEFCVLNDRVIAGNVKPSEEESIIQKQGPYSPKLVEYIKQHKNDYDCFIFFTYLYYPTTEGIVQVDGRSVLVPTAHDEPFLRLKTYEETFHAPGAILFNTEEERDLVHQRFHNEEIPYRIGAAGIDIPQDISGERFVEKYGIENFILYMGRIDFSKNCQQLFAYFKKYKRRNKNDLKLVLMGKPAIQLPQRDDIISLGFVDDQDKFDGLKAAKALVLPSKFESLSFVVIEAMRVETPVIVNGECEVLKQHCLKSNGAFYYMNYLEFESELNYLLEHREKADVMRANAKSYADSNYQWSGVVDRIKSLISGIETIQEA